jgi:hypothetical protein
MDFWGKLIFFTFEEITGPWLVKIREARDLLKINIGIHFSDPKIR